MHTYIIAEAGVNHNGNIKTAKRLVEAAKEAGCDCVKFQTFQAEKSVVPTAQKAAYQKENTGKEESQLAMLKKLELSEKEFCELKNYCMQIDIDFLSTPFEKDSVDLLDRLNVAQYKIPSGEITNKPLIQYIASKGKRILLSTGMSTLDEVKEAVNWIYATGNKDIVLFHCTTNYPAAYSNINMRAMLTLKETFHVPIGYSDHTEGIEIPFMAVAMGASMIEKHFTLDRNMRGPDHKASLEPSELQAMVQGIRKIEEAFGTGVKIPALSELENRDVARKSLVFSRNITSGSIISENDILCKRPGNGLPPKLIDSVLGKKILTDVLENEQVRQDMFEN